MIKLIATDIDGTLVKDGTLQIDAEYMTVIDKLIRKGIHVVVCSGRQFVSEKKLFSRSGMNCSILQMGELLSELRTKSCSFYDAGGGLEGNVPDGS